MSEVMREFIYMPSDLPVAAMMMILRERYYKKYNLEE